MVCFVCAFMNKRVAVVHVWFGCNNFVTPLMVNLCIVLHNTRQINFHFRQFLFRIILNVAWNCVEKVGLYLSVLQKMDNE